MVDWSSLTRDTAHRPWPLPTRPWVMTMSWLDLLFAHWSFEPAEIRARLPEALELDTFEGRAWVGVVPFRMASVGPRGLGWLPAALPGPRAFPELNVRTYVRHEGKPGVWFFSLDAASPLAVWAARTFFHLPYFRADMRVRERDGWIEYESRRRDRRLGAGVFDGRYRPLDEGFRTRPGSLEHWLTERYCLYALDRRGRLWRGEIHHRPWPLFTAEAEIATNTVTKAHGLILDEAEGPLFHFVRRLDVVAWWLEELATAPQGTS